MPWILAGRHRLGGVEFIVGHRELSRLPSDRIADLQSRARIREALLANGHREAHKMLPVSGWLAVSLDRGQSRRARDRAVLAVSERALGVLRWRASARSES
jgi:hypothetical protein